MSSATRNILRADHQGSIVAVANSAGKSRGVNRYDSYGVSAAPIVGRFAYTGQIVIPELDMYHYKARMCSPALGRFLQTDTVGYDDDANLYAYVQNDPLNKVDPTGKNGVAVAIEEVIVVGSAVSACGSTPSCTSYTGAAAEEIGKQISRQMDFSMMFGRWLLSAPWLDGDDGTVMASTPEKTEGKTEEKTEEKTREKKDPIPGVGGKEGAKDVPSWAKGERPFKGESGKQFADRLLGQKYGAGKFKTGPGSEHSKIRKWGDRSFK